jgi:hypothetical protein
MQDTVRKIILDIIHEEVERHGEDVNEAIQAARGRIEPLPEYKAMAFGMANSFIAHEAHEWHHKLANAARYKPDRLRQLKAMYEELGILQGTQERGSKNKLKNRWWEMAKVMRKLLVPQERIDELLRQQDPDLLGALIKELEAEKAAPQAAGGDDNTPRATPLGAHAGDQGEGEEEEARPALDGGGDRHAGPQRAAGPHRRLAAATGP